MNTKFVIVKQTYSYEGVAKPFIAAHCYLMANTMIKSPSQTGGVK